MTLVQQVRIFKPDFWEQSGSRTGHKRRNTSLNSIRHQKKTLPAFTFKPATKKETMAIVKQLIKKNPETLKLLNNGKKAVKQ